MLFHPICGSGSCPSRSASRPARLRNEHDRFGHVRIEGEIPMFDYEKSSGVDITSKENYFFYPPRRLQGGESRKNPCFFCPPRPERIRILPAGGGDWSTFKIIVQSTRTQRNGSLEYLIINQGLRGIE
jgi:hypothetical protein